MSIAELGSLGEFFGSIAVLVTLLYLAAQVKSARSAMTAQAHQARADIAHTSIESIYNSPYLPEIFSRTMFTDQPEASEGPDLVRVMNFIQAQLRIIENFYFQHRQGLMSEAIINAHRNALLNGFFFDNNVARFQWEATRDTFDPAFIRWVDAAFAERPPTHAIPTPTLPDHPGGPSILANEETAHARP